MSEPFRSLNALRAEHTKLLRELREHDDDALPPPFIAKVQEFLQRGQATGVLLDVDEDRADAQTLLNYWTTVLYNAGVAGKLALLADFDPAASRELVGDISPYVGLRSFLQKESPVFFGRRRLVRRVTEWLESHRFAALVGLSGSGKSSLVRAGVVPDLREGAVTGSQDWRYLEPMVPGADPVRSLAELTCPAGTPLEQWQAIVSADNDTFVRSMGTAPVVLVVDQLEELFTISKPKAACEVFVAQLVRLVTITEPRHTVIVTLRSDFEGSLLRHPRLVDLFSGDAVVRVPPLDPAGLRDAIVRPAARLGVSFGVGLVEELVQQVLGEPAGLPLLQFTLLKLWERREGKTITWSAYQSLGGNVRQILANAASETYESFKLEEDRRIVEQVLKKLITPGLGGEATSKRLPRAELYPEDAARDRVERVLEILVNKGLLRVTPGSSRDADQIEITHEALLRNWPLLTDWIAEDRGNQRKRLQLAAAAEWWRLTDEHPSGLLTGLRLAEAEQYKDLKPEEHRFVQASRAAVGRSRRNMWILTVAAFLVAMGLLAWATVKTVQVSQAIDEKRQIEEKTKEAREQFDQVAKELAAKREEVRSIEAARNAAQKVAVETQTELRETEKQLEELDRPTVRLGAGKFTAPRGPWEHLARYASPIEENARSVAQLRIDGNFRATGFLVAEDVIAAMWLDSLWSPDRVTVDFGPQPGTKEPLRLKVTQVLASDSKFDIMIFRIERPPSGALPKPLRLDFSLPRVREAVYVVGYLSGQSDKKRVQPGYVISIDSDGFLTHDCLTGAGSSGSPLIDLATGKVIGIHWGGTPRRAGPDLKRAVAIASLRGILNSLGGR